MPVLKSRLVRLLVLCVLAIACIGCDQATKKFATDRLIHVGPVSLLGGTLRLQYAENPGGFLGWGGHFSPAARFAFLVVVNAAVLGGVAWALIVPSRLTRANFIALALILTGGIGNLIDRLSNDGLVTDFLNVGIGPLRTGIFNVADVAISTGAIVLFIAMWRTGNQAPGSG
jgi:signal peptidase II